jgi:hypothetical protein
MNLSEHFTLEEAVKSETAQDACIDNTPTEFIIEAMKNTASEMEKVRTLLGFPLHVNSWYRCLALNNAVGSKPTSQHIKGEAVDFICPDFGTPTEICKTLVDYSGFIGFDELILEHTWIHISFCSNPNSVPRNRVLSLLASKTYATGLTDVHGNPVA